MGRFRRQSCRKERAVAQSPNAPGQRNCCDRTLRPLCAPLSCGHLLVVFQEGEPPDRQHPKVLRGASRKGCQDNAVASSPAIRLLSPVTICSKAFHDSAAQISDLAFELAAEVAEVPFGIAFQGRQLHTLPITSTVISG